MQAASGLHYASNLAVKGAAGEGTTGAVGAIEGSAGLLARRGPAQDGVDPAGVGVDAAHAVVLGVDDVQVAAGVGVLHAAALDHDHRRPHLRVGEDGPEDGPHDDDRDGNVPRQEDDKLTTTQILLVPMCGGRLLVLIFLRRGHAPRSITGRYKNLASYASMTVIFRVTGNATL